jgi:hypothetical protein
MKRGIRRGRYQKQQEKIKNIGGMRATREQGGK